MARSSRGLAALGWVFLYATLSNCGGGAAQAGGGAAPGAPSPDSPAGQCLAIAGAKRTRNPSEPPKIGVRHVLVQYAGAKRAVSSVKRTREEACLRALEARDSLRGGADFVDIVKKYSDEPGAATRAGSLGSIERSEAAPPFADAAFELRMNEFSDIVETDFGFHVIMRTQ